MTPTRVMINTLAVLFVIGLVWLVIQIRSIMLVLILGILLAAAIEPLVNRLRRRGFSRGQAIMAIYAGLLLTLALLIYLVVPPLITQATGLFDEIPGIFDNLEQQAVASRNDFIRSAGVRTIRRLDSTWTNLQTNPPIGTDTALGLVTSVLGVLVTTVTVMIVAFYWMTEKAIIKRLILGLVPLDRRDRAHGLWDEIEGKLGGWTRGQLILMGVIGVISAIAYFALGLEFWLPLGIWAGLTELIPFIGPFLGGAAAVLVALTESWQKALIVVGFVLILQQLEGSVLVPRVMRNAVGMSPLTVILAVLIGGVLLGPFGSVLAIPVGAAVQVVLQDLLRERENDIDTGETGERMAAALAGRLEQVVPPPAIEPVGAGRGAAGDGGD